ncbi:MAG: tRNA dihydrouridine(20/20a) synthase DusA, partial [Rhizobiaceae bacterium]|nr:tRNA dihydrouridine(20/20a) synthase DusA [Rhizobiaceae bacterium]
HMTGLFTGRPGARRWRQTLSDAGSRRDAGPELFFEALANVDLDAPVRAAA